MATDDYVDVYAFAVLVALWPVVTDFVAHGLVILDCLDALGAARGLVLWIVDRASTATIGLMRPLSRVRSEGHDPEYQRQIYIFKKISMYI